MLSSTSSSSSSSSIGNTSYQSAQNILDLEKAKTDLKSIYGDTQSVPGAEDEDYINSIVNDLHECGLLNDKVIEDITENFKNKGSNRSIDDTTEYGKCTASVIRNLKDADFLKNSISMLALVLQYRLDKVDNIIQTLKQGKGENGLMTEQTLRNIFGLLPIYGDTQSVPGAEDEDYINSIVNDLHECGLLNDKVIEDITENFKNKGSNRSIDDMTEYGKCTASVIRNLKDAGFLKNSISMLALVLQYRLDKVDNIIQTLKQGKGENGLMTEETLRNIFQRSSDESSTQKKFSYIRFPAATSEDIGSIQQAQQNLHGPAPLRALQRLQNLYGPYHLQMLQILQNLYGPNYLQMLQMLENFHGLHDLLKVQVLQNLHGSVPLQTLQRLQNLYGPYHLHMLRTLKNLYGPKNLLDLQILQNFYGNNSSYKALSTLLQNLSNSGNPQPQILINPKSETQQFEKTRDDNRVRYTSKFLTALADLELLSKLTSDDLRIIIENAELGFIDIAEALLEKEFITVHEFAELLFNYLREEARYLEGIGSFDERTWDSRTQSHRSTEADELHQFLAFLKKYTLPESDHRKNLEKVCNHILQEKDLLMSLMSSMPAALKILKETGCFNYQIIKEIVEHPEEIETLFRYIVELLDQEFIQYDDEDELQLTQTNLLKLCTHIKVFAYEDVWDAMLNFPVNTAEGTPNMQRAFDIVVAYCRVNTRQRPRDIANIVTRELNALLGLDAPGFNPKQSTHTPSIERSISQVAQKLNERYGAAVKDDKLSLIFEEIETYLGTLDAEEITKNTAKITQKMINGAAQRCFNRLKQVKTGHFADKVSQVNTRTLLGLVWFALHDKEFETGDKSVEAHLIQGLYEIQRGDNFNEFGEDNLRPTDVNVCPRGAFNKLINVVWNRHPDAMNMVYVNQATITAKLETLVTNQVMNFFEDEINKCTDANMCTKVVHTLNEVENNGLGEALWAQIKDKVEKSVYSTEEDVASKWSVALEYEMIPEKHQTEEDFVSFYNAFCESAAGIKLREKKHNELRKLLSESEGYKSYLTQSMIKSHNFSNPYFFNSIQPSISSLKRQRDDSTLSSTHLPKKAKINPSASSLKRPLSGDPNLPSNPQKKVKLDPSNTVNFA